MFKPHALLLRGSLYGLWRQEDEAVNDLQAVIATSDLQVQVHTISLSLSSSLCP